MSTFNQASVMNNQVVEAQVCAAELDFAQQQNHKLHAALSALIITATFLVSSAIS